MITSLGSDKESHEALLKDLIEEHITKTNPMLYVNIIAYKVYLIMYMYALLIFNNKPYTKEDKYTK